MMEAMLGRTRNRIHLGQVLGRGGEGIVYEIVEQPNHVAKIYSSPPDQAKIRKLELMAQAASQPLLRIAAWPVDLVKDDRGLVLGFVMQRAIARRDIHELYSPKSRADAFPEADFQFLCCVAANVARAFATVHEHRIVVGDVNHGNLLVGLDGTVVFIDCDSFQIKMGSTVATCDVGVPLFTPPELQGLRLRGLVRTVDHDRFGLAVLLFHILFQGRHPFAGRYRGPDDMSIERAIAEYRFAYGPDSATHWMERPPGAIPLETMGEAIAASFVQAFVRRGKEEGRPSARSWILAVENLRNRLWVCSTADWHHYPKELKSCPWCALESQAAVRLFGHRVRVDGSIGIVDISALWQALISVPGPGADPVLPSERPWSPPPGTELPSITLRFLRKLISVALVCTALVACTSLTTGSERALSFLAFGLAYAVWPRIPREKRLAAERAYSTANGTWREVSERWQREAACAVFWEKRASLKRAHFEHAGLQNERVRRLKQLYEQRKSDQLQRYLLRYRIERSSIQGIGPGRASMLASYGIETAADVGYREVVGVPGFGEVLADRLVSWRRDLERNFQFNADEPVDPSQIAALDRELAARRQALVEILRQGPDSLQQLSREIMAARLRLMPLAEKAWDDLQLAQLRRKAL